VLTTGGKDSWYAGTVRSILRNEKYRGDALLQKSCRSQVPTVTLGAGRTELGGERDNDVVALLTKLKQNVDHQNTREKFDRGEIVTFPKLDLNIQNTQTQCACFWGMIDLHRIRFELSIFAFSLIYQGFPAFCTPLLEIV